MRIAGPSPRTTRATRRIDRDALGLRRVGALVVAATLVFALPSVHDDSTTTSLIEQLKKSPDHRVRALAALSLGTSDDAEATKPLCKCLGDQSEVDSVRVACAAA